MRKKFLTNLIKSHFLAVNEIQRQNTVPSRSNSDMNYPHFYITFLFTFLIDVSSVSYIIFIIYIIYIYHMLLLYHEKLQIMAFIYSNTTSYHTFVFWFLNTVLLTVFVHSNQWHTCSFCKFDRRKNAQIILYFFYFWLGLKYFNLYLF